MVKIRYPLQSFFASGSLNDVLTFFTRHGISYVRQKQKNPISESEAQVLLRDVFKDAAAAAQLLTEKQKVYYHNLDPHSAACPWYNNFIREYIKEFYVGVGVSIKSLQTGTIVFTDEYTVYETITSVDKDYSLLLLMGQAPADADFRSTYARLGWSNNTTIFGSRGAVVHGLTVGYIVIEFGGLVKKILHEQIICEGVTDNTKTIEGRALDRTLLFHNGCSSDFDSWGCVLSRIWLDNETTLHAKKVDFNGWTSTMIEVMEIPA